jgi:hypothetical protein
MSRKNLYDEPISTKEAATKKIESSSIEKDFEQDVYKEF